MSAAQPTERFPRFALLLAAALVGTTLLAVSVARFARIAPQASPTLERAADHVAAVKALDLRFSDRPDGSVQIIDLATGRVAGGVEAGSTSGFIRGVMRGLARDRRKRGVGQEPPFRLTLWANGQLSLLDTTSGFTTDLSAFGPTNRAAFEALLK